MKEKICKLIKKKISFNKKKVNECDEILSGSFSSLLYKVENIRLYHLGAIKELKSLLKEMETLANDYN